MNTRNFQSKVLSLCMVLTMVLTTGVPAFAADGGSDNAASAQNEEQLESKATENVSKSESTDTDTDAVDTSQKTEEKKETETVNSQETNNTDSKLSEGTTSATPSDLTKSNQTNETSNNSSVKASAGEKQSASSSNQIAVQSMEEDDDTVVLKAAKASTNYKGDYFIYQGETIKVSGSQGSKDEKETWTSSDKNIVKTAARNSGKANFTAGTKNGTAIVTHTYSTRLLFVKKTYKEKFQVTVFENPGENDSLQVAPTSMKIKAGKTQDLNAYLSLPDGNEEVVPTWTSSNTAVATVDTDNLEVKGVAKGTATITAKVEYTDGAEVKTLSQDISVEVWSDEEDIPTGEIDLEVTDGEKIYDGSPLTSTAAVASVTEGTTISYSIDGGKNWTKDAPSITNVSESCTVNVKAENENYETAYADYTLTVKPKEVTVTAYDWTKTYGDPDPDEFYANVQGLINGDKIKYTVSRPSAGTIESRGYYPGTIKATGDKEQGNYTVTYHDGEFIILARQATVRAKNASKVYGAEDPKFEATVSNVMPGDTLTYTLYRKGVGSNENVGTYGGSIIAVGAAEQLEGNYQITYSPGDFEITKSGKLTVEAQDSSKDYDGEKLESEAVTVNDTDGTTISYKVGDGDWTEEAPSITDAKDSCTVKVKAENPNYETATTEYNLTVNPIKITISDTKTVEWTGEEQTLVIAKDGGGYGQVAGENIILKGAEIKGTDVGEYTDLAGDYELKITKANGEDSTSNYEATVSGKLIIEKSEDKDSSDSPDKNDSDNTNSNSSNNNNSSNSSNNNNSSNSSNGSNSSDSSNTSSNAVQTGDHTPIGMLIGLMVLALAGAGFTISCRRRGNAK